DLRILARHLVPNTLAPVIVAATLIVGGAILTEAALSFLGIGIQPPVPSWGNMLQNAQDFILTAPRLAFYPGLMIFLTVLCFNFLGTASGTPWTRGSSSRPTPGRVRVRVMVPGRVTVAGAPPAGGIRSPSGKGFGAG